MYNLEVKRLRAFKNGFPPYVIRSINLVVFHFQFCQDSGIIHFTRDIRFSCTRELRSLLLICGVHSRDKTTASSMTLIPSQYLLTTSSLLSWGSLAYWNMARTYLAQSIQTARSCLEVRRKWRFVLAPSMQWKRWGTWSAKSLESR